MDKTRATMIRYLLLALVVLGLGAASCADTTPGKYVKVLSESEAADLQQWRLVLGLVLAGEFLVTLVAAVKAGANSFAGSMVGYALAIPIHWTVFGEWGYRLSAWVFSWGVAGKVMAVLGGLVVGGVGLAPSSEVFAAAFIFNDLDIVKWTGVPAAIASGLLCIGMIVKAANR
jgi:hypothetical protein